MRGLKKARVTRAAKNAVKLAENKQRLRDETVVFQKGEFDSVVGPDSNYIGVFAELDGDSTIEIVEFSTLSASISLSLVEAIEFRGALDKAIKHSRKVTFVDSFPELSYS